MKSYKSFNVILVCLRVQNVLMKLFLRTVLCVAINNALLNFSELFKTDTKYRLSTL